MKFEQLLDCGRQRFYKLPEEITYGVRGNKVTESTKYVVVSDAHTHIERLVFPFYLGNGFTEEDVLNGVSGSVRIDYLEIAGEMTMMIHGGDEESIKEDTCYLNQLIDANSKKEEIL